MAATLAWLSRPDATQSSGRVFNFVDANGNYINPSAMGYCAFRSWLLGATSVNSAYMLSVQLASMELNVHFGFVDPSAMIYAPGTNTANTAGFATLSVVMQEANDSLGSNPYVVAGSVLNSNVTLKTYQTTVKDALDNANNNLNFVQGQPCPFSF
jgi:hypothetical protein